MIEKMSLQENFIIINLRESKLMVKGCFLILQNHANWKTVKKNGHTVSKSLKKCQIFEDLEFGINRECTRVPLSLTLSCSSLSALFFPFYSNAIVCRYLLHTVPLKCQ